MKFLAMLFWCAAAAFAQSASAPRLGWAFGDQPGRIQEVLGVPGAAQLAPAVTLCDAKVVALRPGSNLAAVVRADGSAGLLRLLPGGQDSSWEPLEQAVPDVEDAAWSPLGRALLLASPASGRLQVWLVEDGMLRLSHELPLAASRAAVSDAGTVLAEVDGVLFRAGRDGSMEAVSPHSAGSFTFLAGSERHAWLEGPVLRLEGGDLPPATVELNGGGEGPRLLFSLHGVPLGVVEPGPAGSVLTVWNGNGEKQGEWTCPAAVDRLAASGLEGVVQLITHEPGPVWMASFSQAGGRVFFVPGAGKEGEQQ